MWFLNLFLPKNSLPQSWHTSINPRMCIISPCVRRWDRLGKLLPQSSHTCLKFFSWTILMCVRSESLLASILPHWGHGSDRALVSCVLWWLASVRGSLKDLPQSATGQGNRLTRISCTARTCRFRFFSVDNAAVHMLQEYFRPLWAKSIWSSNSFLRPGVLYCKLHPVTHQEKWKKQEDNGKIKGRFTFNRYR